MNVVFILAINEHDARAYPHIPPASQVLLLLLRRLVNEVVRIFLVVHHFQILM